MNTSCTCFYLGEKLDLVCLMDLIRWTALKVGTRRATGATMSAEPLGPGVAAWPWVGDLLPQRSVRGAAAERADYRDISSSVVGPNVSATCVGLISCRPLTSLSGSYGSGIHLQVQHSSPGFQATKVVPPGAVQMAAEGAAAQTAMGQLHSRVCTLLAGGLGFP